MSPVELYAKYLNEKNADGLCSLFADDFIFDDRGGQDLGNPPMIFKDKAAYRKKMESLFQSITDWEIEFVKAECNVLFYNVRLNGGYLPCVGVARYDKIGKMTEYRVFVREERQF